MKWQAVISKESNGFSVRFDDMESSYTNVYEEVENRDLNSNENDKEHIVEMFWDILEHFGEGGSKHDSKRLTVTYEKQEE